MAIRYIKETSTFFLDNKNMTYAFTITEGFLNHLYFGKRIGYDDIRYTRNAGGNPLYTLSGKGTIYEAHAPEISFYGTGDFHEPTVQVENMSGDRLCDLLFDGYEILESKPKISGMPSLDGGETLVIHLKDRITDFAADMYYTLYDDADVIARRIVYKNMSNAPVTLNRAYSFTLELPERNYRIMSLYGAWASERAVEVTPTHHGVFSIDSKRTSSSNTLNPFMGVLSEGANETAGEVWGISLIYSSSFILKAEGTYNGDTYFTGGINDFDFSWSLEPGQSFETPEIAIAYSQEGLGGMSRAFHDIFREHLINPDYVYKKRPIVINNWEGTSFNFNEEKLKAIIDGVKGTGIDTFVLDDGWFGKRNDTKSSLGDWFTNKEKLPNGIKGIADYAHSKGLRFGLWFEPEMVSEDSELYRAHPDFAIKAENRPNSTSRDQLVLDLTRKDVRDCVIETVNKVIRENGIDYVKWDSNRFVTESVSKSLPAHRQKEFAHRYILGLYDMLDRIVKANPYVLFEGCSGGGARFDPAVLHYFPQIWTSDNSDAEARTFIQYGTSMVYPPSSMSCHITRPKGRDVSLKTRADIAGMGPFGYELDASNFTDEDRAAAREVIDEYKEWNEELVLRGDLYRMESPYDNNYFAYSLVSKDRSRAVMVYYRRTFYMNIQTKRVKMQGLDPEKYYYVPELDRICKGSTLMNVGIVCDRNTRQDFFTMKYHFIER